MRARALCLPDGVVVRGMDALGGREQVVAGLALLSAESSCASGAQQVHCDIQSKPSNVFW